MRTLALGNGTGALDPPSIASSRKHSPAQRQFQPYFKLDKRHATGDKSKSARASVCTNSLLSVKRRPLHPESIRANGCAQEVASRVANIVQIHGGLRFITDYPSEQF